MIMPIKSPIPSGFRWTAKRRLKLGLFLRGGKNRIEQNALDHDFEPEEKLTPFGVYIPELCESHFWFSIGPVTAELHGRPARRTLDKAKQTVPEF